MIRVCVHDKIITICMQKSGKIFDENCHNMAIDPLYAIKQGLELTCMKNGVLMVVA
jgi:hypothetical protein